MFRWLKKVKPPVSGEGMYVTPLPGGGWQETLFREDGVTPAATEYLDSRGKLTRTEYHNEHGEVIDSEEF
jgi:hypothetical protein